MTGSDESEVRNRIDVLSDTSFSVVLLLFSNRLEFFMSRGRSCVVVLTTSATIQFEVTLTTAETLLTSVAGMSLKINLYNNMAEVQK
jgi:hypothetical protein